MKKEKILRLVELLGDDYLPAEEEKALLADIRASFDFNKGFTGRVMQRLEGLEPGRLYDGVIISMNSLFLRIAITGAAAIILLAVSVFLSGGDLSFETLLGLGNTTEEGMISLLSGNY
ncbi:MAG: hypothetical protein MUC78_00155 [Bacteroidales bacterium]|jgi:hypothetical protein|nr:hypothetical protein [Bacteroidales bacterium]